jgi:phospholipid transport system substrate-binding protein
MPARGRGEPACAAAPLDAAPPPANVVRDHGGGCPARPAAGSRKGAIMTRRFLGALTAVMLLATNPAGADPAHDASAFVEELGDRLVSVLKQPDVGHDELRAKLRALFVDAFDVPAVGRFVLGRHWAKASEAQRTEYLDLFEKYVGEIYASQFSDYSGETFKIREQTPLSGGDVLVRLDIIRPDGPPLPVDFRVRATGNGLRIVDVAVEGLSLIVTKRDEFSSLIARKGIDGLLDALRRATG